MTITFDYEGAPEATPRRLRILATTSPDVDLLAALENAARGPALLAHTVLSAAELMSGEPTKAIDRLQPLGNTSAPSSASDQLLLSLAHLRLADVDKAKSLLRLAV